jgi:hypothetical protein
MLDLSKESIVPSDSSRRLGRLGRQSALVTADSSGRLAETIHQFGPGRRNAIDTPTGCRRPWRKTKAGQ